MKKISMIAACALTLSMFTIGIDDVMLKTVINANAGSIAVGRQKTT